MNNNTFQQENLLGRFEGHVLELPSNIVGGGIDAESVGDDKTGDTLTQTGSTGGDDWDFHFE
jgi:hypothetical protein